MKTQRGQARKARRAQLYRAYIPAIPVEIPLYISHVWDEDSCCVHCGFDGAEWWHWKHRTYEGRASDERMPICERRFK